MPTPMLYQPPQQMVYHPNLLPPGYIPTSPEPMPHYHLHPQELEYLYRSTRSLHSMPSIEYDMQKDEERKQRKREKRQQRREMEKAFTYTGLDRAIAESFLEQQDRANQSQMGDPSSFTSDEEFQRSTAIGKRYGDVAM